MQVAGGCSLLLGGLRDPPRDGGGVGALVQGSAVLGKPLTSAPEPFTRVLSSRVVVGIRVGRDDEPGSLSRSFGLEELLEPRVDGLDQGVFAHVDVSGVVMDGESGTSAAQLAAVVATAPGLPLTGHPSAARDAEHAAAQQVGHVRGSGRSYVSRCHCQHALPIVTVDQGIVRGLG